jgi:RNA recognition motif-containing protein
LRGFRTGTRAYAEGKCTDAMAACTADLEEGTMPVQLFVGNLSYQATEAELREHFSAVGPLVSLRLPTDRESGRPRGFAFVEFHAPAQAEEAIRRFNNQPFQGRPLTVNPAHAREQHSGVRTPASAPPSLPSTDGAPKPGVADTQPARRGGARRNFGPDAARRGQRKPATRRPKASRGSKEPSRVRRGGQFFGGDEEAADGDGLSEGTFTTSQE